MALRPELHPHLPLPIPVPHDPDALDLATPADEGAAGVAEPLGAANEARQVIEAEVAVANEAGGLVGGEEGGGVAGGVEGVGA